MKGPAENNVVLLLVEEILQDGFVTGGDPLLLIQSTALNDVVTKAAQWVSKQLSLGAKH